MLKATWWSDVETGPFGHSDAADRIRYGRFTMSLTIEEIQAIKSAPDMMINYYEPVHGILVGYKADGRR